MNAERRRAGTDASFALVVFDPPHFERNGSSGWVGLKYGTLKGDWREMLRAGFAECFRVLKPEGTLISFRGLKPPTENRTKSENNTCIVRTMCEYEG